MTPIVADIVAAISTIPADMSFALFIVSSCSVVILSESSSIALLAISAHITAEIQMSVAIHSVLLMLNSNPAMITSTVKAKCIFIFRSCFNV